MRCPLSHGVREAPEPVAGPDALPIPDPDRCHPPGVAALGIHHENIDNSAGERGSAPRIRTVKSRHSRIEGFPCDNRDIATECPGIYLR